MTFVAKAPLPECTFLQQIQGGSRVMVGKERVTTHFKKTQNKKKKNSINQDLFCQLKSSYPPKIKL